jgi:peptidyl-prolyl cis-trans isomerase A (cyclophilin A)
MKLLPALALLAATAAPALGQAQNPQVLFDTDYGPVVVELQANLAPELVTNFLRYVDAGRYDRTLFERVAKRNAQGQGIDIVQGGGFTEAAVPLTTFDSVSTQVRSGMSNIRGSLAVALPNNSAGQPNLNAVTSAFYFNVGDNSTALNSGYPTFGRVTYGLANLDSMLNTPRFTGRESPIRPPLVKRVRRVQGFPILDIHSGAWFDPAKAGRGFSVEVANAAGSEAGPLIVVYWYDYFEGRQVWMNGAASFAWGDHEVAIPMQITSGGQFGAAFNPATVQTDSSWGTLTVRFTGCDRATFSYTSRFGNGSTSLQKLTLPTTARCNGN